MSKISSFVASLKVQQPDEHLKIHNVITFTALMRHERKRADRTGQVLSIVVFDYSGKSIKETKEICESVKRSIRSIDEIGCMEVNKFGVLLPATDNAGARVFAERASGNKISYSLFTYPNQWTPEYSKARIDDKKDGGADNGSTFAIAMPTWKRAIDIFGSLFGIVFLFPISLLIGLYIKVVSPGPVFFKQQRVGQNGKLFTFIKFRTMKFGNDQTTHQEHIVKRIRLGTSLDKMDDHDTRIIPGGRLLRRSCVDELPQLLNVLKGDMSLVGPRPCLPYEAQEFEMWHAHRFDILPGMTGLWQVSGKNKLSFAQMIRLDISYAERLSLGSDLLILARTIPAIITMLLEAVAKKLTRGGQPAVKPTLASVQYTKAPSSVSVSTSVHEESRIHISMG
jgi:lipopolysaccharide/colanic/teichoic acid biosynthesis glycosyltransferase